MLREILLAAKDGHAFVSRSVSCGALSPGASAPGGLLPSGYFCAGIGSHVPERSAEKRMVLFQMINPSSCKLIPRK